MKLLEYEAKEVLRKYGLVTPAGEVLRVGDVPAEYPVVVKAQVPAGGRGKAGGVRKVRTGREFAEMRGSLLGKEFLGFGVKALLAEEVLEPERELYVAVALDRTRQELVLLAHDFGGVEIEDAVRERGAAFREVLVARPDEALSKRLGKYLGLAEGLWPKVGTIAGGLWDVCVNEDATLTEVNPLMAMADGRMVCADAKIELDDAAAFRHPEWSFEQEPASGQFVVLSPEGTVASLANGAGLGMATNDAIAAAGAEAANFFDVGGGTNARDMARGFGRIQALPNVRAIVVNIFGGITRCDEVAEAILAARNADTPPLFIRLAGTNAAEGAALLRAAGVQLYATLEECVERAAALGAHAAAGHNRV